MTKRTLRRGKERTMTSTWGENFPGKSAIPNYNRPAGEKIKQRGENVFEKVTPNAKNLFTRSIKDPRLINGGGGYSPIRNPHCSIVDTGCKVIGDRKVVL